MKNDLILYPNIRFKGFNNAWELYKLEDICLFLKGNSLSWDDVCEDGKRQCILYGNLYTNYGMITDKVVYKTNSYSHSFLLSKKYDVLIPGDDTTPTGLARATSIEVDNVILGGGINVLRSESFNGSFLSISLNKNKKKIIPLITGTTVRHLNNSSLKTICLSLTNDADEQIKVRNLFYSIDSVIFSYQKKYEKLIDIKKSLLDELLFCNGCGNPKIRFNSFSNNWEIKTLEDISMYRVSMLTTDSILQEGKYPVFDANVQIGYSNDNKISTDYLTIIKDGSGAGRTRKLPRDTYFISTMGGIIPLESDINYLFALMQRFDFSLYINGSTIPHVYYSDYCKQLMMVPQIEEQIKIGKVFEKIDTLINLHQKRIEKYKLIKQALLFDVII